MRISRLLSVCVALVALAGCATTGPLVTLGSLGECPGESVTGLIERANHLGAGTSTRDLECVLGYLREVDDDRLLRTDLGSRVALYLAERETDQSRREALAREGEAFAEEALEQGAEDVGSIHYYLAANLGLAVRKHPVLGAESMVRLKRELDLAVGLSPDLDQGGPLRLLGMLYLKAPPWPTGIGDGDQALELLKKAVDRHPEHPLNHLFYAQALWEVEGESAAEQARSQLSQGRARLQAGQWGYSLEPWEMEFAEVARELGVH